MNHFYRVNIYETQAILYWILGFLILHFGDWRWLGWVSIVWGWLTFASVIFLSIKNSNEIIGSFTPPLTNKK